MADIIHNDQPHIFRKEGEYWTIAYAGMLCRLRHSRGLQHLAHLLRQPGVKVPVTVLEVGDRAYAGSEHSPEAAERARVNVTRAIKTALGKITAHHAPLGDHLNATVRTGARCLYTPDPRMRAEWDV